MCVMSGDTASLIPVYIILSNSEILLPMSFFGFNFNAINFLVVVYDTAQNEALVSLKIGAQQFVGSFE